MSGKTAKAARRAANASTQKPARAQSPRARAGERNRWRPALWVGLAVVLAIGGLYALTGRNSNDTTSQAGAGGDGSSAYPYEIGSPGTGEQAPPVKLPATAGGTFDLAAYRGEQPVLLYFQEGLACQPCWDQIVAMQQDRAKFEALGIGPIVSITTDRLDLIEQKVKDEGITFPVLSDPTAKVSDSYDARSYGMMGGSTNGHTFVLVDKDGSILWRADYGGPPKYTMFVPDDVVLVELRKAIKPA